MPNWLGAIDIGPLRLSAYSSTMAALPQALFASVFSVRAFCTPKTVRICRWSCRFSPTPGAFVGDVDVEAGEQFGLADAGKLHDLG